MRLIRKDPGRDLGRGRFLVAVVAILVLAAVLQATELDLKNYWDDESTTAGVSSQPTFDEFLDSFKLTERQPPLHQLILFAWIRLAGTSDTAMRVPSVVFSVGSVALLMVLGLQIAGRKEALLAALLLAVAPTLMLYGRMTRYFSTAMFMGLAATAALVAALDREDEGRPALGYWVIYGVSSVAMLLSSYSNWGLFGAHLLWVLMKKGRRLFQPKGWMVAVGAVALFALAWMAVEQARVTGVTDRLTAVYTSLGRAISLNLAYPMHSFTVGETIFPWNPLAFASLLAFTGVLLLGLGRARRGTAAERLPAIASAAILLFTAVGFELVALTLAFMDVPSRALTALPFFLLVAAMGLVRLRPGLLLVAMAVMVAASAVSIGNYYAGRQFHNPKYTIPRVQMLQVVLDNACPGDVMVAESIINVNHYYRPGDGVPELLTIRNNPNILEEIRNADRVWLVKYQGSPVRPKRSVPFSRLPFLLATPDPATRIAMTHSEQSVWNFVRRESRYRLLQQLIGVGGGEGSEYVASVNLYSKANSACRSE